MNGQRDAVSQTGVQILTGFLLTLPFQQRFEQLDPFEVRTFLVVVLLVFSVVVGRPEALVVAGVVLLGLAVLWGALPLAVRRSG